MALYQPAGREASDDPRRSGPLLDSIYVILVWAAVKQLLISKQKKTDFEKKLTTFFLCASGMLR